MVGMEDIVGGQGRRRRNKEGPDFSNIHRDRHPGGLEAMDVHEHSPTLILRFGLKMKRGKVRYQPIVPTVSPCVIVGRSRF
jgi:hypothetical protein